MENSVYKLPAPPPPVMLDPTFRPTPLMLNKEFMPKPNFAPKPATTIVVSGSTLPENNPGLFPNLAPAQPPLYQKLRPYLPAAIVIGAVLLFFYSRGSKISTRRRSNPVLPEYEKTLSLLFNADANRKPRVPRTRKPPRESRKTRDEWEIQAKYPRGNRDVWETVTVEETAVDAKRSLREYRENDSYALAHRIVKKRIKND